MRIQDILVESQQLDEGPILNKIGTGIGKLAGGAAKAVGAVAGGIAGAGQAIKKGYQAGKQTVAGAGDDEEPAAAGGATPAAPGRLATAFKAGGQYAKGAMAAGQKPSMAAAADAGVDSAPAAQGAAAAPAAQGAAAAGAPAAGRSMYAQVKANIDKLDKKGKQRILQALQKEVGAAPAAKPAVAPAAAPTPAAGAAPAPKPTKMAAAPVSKTNTVKPGNPNAQSAAGSGMGANAFGQMAKNLTQKPEPQQQKVPPKKTAAATPPPPAARKRIKAGAVPAESKTITKPALAESFSLFRKK